VSREKNTLRSGFLEVFVGPPRHYICKGIKSAIPGNIVMMTNAAMAAIKKGQMPRKIVVKGISGAAPFKTKTLRPTGGVIRPTSRTMTMRTPYQMGSNISDSMIGKMIRKVRIMIA